MCIRDRNKAKREEFWANVEVGKTYTGVVKSRTSYGAFVDIGGVDGLCPVSYTHLDVYKRQASGLRDPRRDRGGAAMLTIEHLTKQFGEKTLFRDLCLTVEGPAVL